MDVQLILNGDLNSTVAVRGFTTSVTLGDLSTSVTSVSSCIDSSPSMIGNNAGFSEVFSGNGVPLNSIFSNCSSQGGGIVFASFSLEGQAGNCINITPNQFTILLVDNPSCESDETATIEACFEATTIQGKVENACSVEGMSGVAVEIKNADGEVVCETITNEDGEYSCDVCVGGEYAVSVTEVCEDHCENGSSTFDLVLMQQSILGYTFEDLEIIAGLLFSSDVRNDGYLSTFDVVCNRFVVLGIPIPDDSACDPGNWCNFIPQIEEEIAILNATDGVSYDYSNTHNTSSASATAGGTIISNFSMYAIGDINCTCDSPVYLSPNDDPIRVTIDSNPKGGYEIILDESTDIEVFSIELDLPNNDVGVQSFSSDNEIDWEYNVVNGKLKVIGINTTGRTQSFSMRSKLFSVSFSSAVSNLNMSNNNENLLLSSSGHLSYLQTTRQVEPLSGLNINNYIQTGDNLQVTLKADVSKNAIITVFDLFGRRVNTTALDRRNTNH